MARPGGAVKPVKSVARGPAQGYQTPMTPLIGITLDWEPPGGYSKFPWYALRENYAGAISGAGGLPVPLPHNHGAVAGYLDRLDALVVTGGAFDVDPALFGDAARHDSVTTKDRRTRFEWAMIDGALARKLPVLGICGGQQLLNVVLGGTLIQHIPDTVPGALAHEQPNPRDEPGHEVAIVADTLLRRVVGCERLAVNSAHHQAVARLGDGVLVNARAGDGVIEGIEHPGHRFCIGVQWHPEFLLSAGDRRLFDALIAEARQ